MNALILDFKLIGEYGLTIAQLVYLLYLSSGRDASIELDGIDIEFLEEEGYIKVETEDNIHLRQKAIELLEFLSVDINYEKPSNNKIVKKSSRAINVELENNLVQFRNKWKGLRAGSMGSLKSCRNKLYRWMIENPEYNMDQIMKAADMYIESLNGDYRFLQRADYFIFKQENNREESSRLSAHIDEIDMVVGDDWTTNLN